MRRLYPGTSRYRRGDVPAALGRLLLHLPCRRRHLLLPLLLRVRGGRSGAAPRAMPQQLRDRRGCCLSDAVGDGRPCRRRRRRPRQLAVDGSHVHRLFVRLHATARERHAQAQLWACAVGEQRVAPPGCHRLLPPRRGALSSGQFVPVSQLSLPAQEVDCREGVRAGGQLVLGGPHACEGWGRAPRHWQQQRQRRGAGENHL